MIANTDFDSKLQTEALPACDIVLALFGLRVDPAKVCRQARTQVEIRGRDQPIVVHMASDPTVLSGLLEPLGQSAHEEAARGRIEEFAS